MSFSTTSCSSQHIKSAEAKSKAEAKAQISQDFRVQKLLTNAWFDYNYFICNSRCRNIKHHMMKLIEIVYFDNIRK